MLLVLLALLLARLMGQYCFAGWRLPSSSSVTLPACGPAGRVGTLPAVGPAGRRHVDGRRAGGRARGWSGGRHCTAGQYGYVPLGRDVVNVVIERCVTQLRLSASRSDTVVGDVVVDTIDARRTYGAWLQCRPR